MRRLAMACDMHTHMYVDWPRLGLLTDLEHDRVASCLLRLDCTEMQEKSSR
jgi:hypothetical protein